MIPILQTPTGHLEKSIEFYTRMGFKRLPVKNRILFSEGRVLLEVNPDRMARAGIKLYKPDLKAEAALLSNETHVMEIDGGYLITDFCGVWIYLIEEECDLDKYLTNSSFTHAGNFAGLSLETVEYETEIRLWEILGFEYKGGGFDQGYITYQYEGFEVSIMRPLCCPHLFFNPSMTFFNSGKNLAVIEKLRSLEIPFEEEITAFNSEGIADNIIVRDPGGYGFFIFND